MLNHSQNMSTALSFFLAMILHPDIQRKAQAEVDSVVGNDRLPNVTDRTSLPYVRSVLTEVLRWNPAVPMGIDYFFLDTTMTQTRILL